MIARTTTTKGMVITRPNPNRPYQSRVSFGSGFAGPIGEIVRTNKILIALQFWQGDKSQALDLARLIADLEPGMCEHADFLFSARFDCRHDDKVIKHVSRKFATYAHTSPRRGVGWPAGCNDLAAGTLEHVYGRMMTSKMPHYKAVFMLEADCCPLNKDWVKLFSHNWDVLQANSLVYVAGRKIQTPHVWEHINGNALYSCDFKFLKWLLQELNSNSGLGWDYRLADEFRKWGWSEIPGLECRWHTLTLSDEQIQAEMDRGIIFEHGIKDWSMLNYVRSKLL